MKEERTMLELINLPDIVLEIILSKLSYDEIAKNRIVCKTFDNVCKKLLNRGFNSVEKYHAQRLKAIKSQLPRRESERMSHPLACHCDILTAIETRISILSMTFTKYIDLNLCCFIPGKVIDEIFRVLRHVTNLPISKAPPRNPEILQELRDISSMAIEHFDENIVPDLKNRYYNSVTSNVNSYQIPSPNQSLIIFHHNSVTKVSPLPATLNPKKLNHIFKKIFGRTKRNKVSLVCVKGQMNKMRVRLNKQSSQIRLQNMKIQEQMKKLKHQDGKLEELKKYVDECRQKLRDISELSRAREDTQIPDTIDGCKRKISTESDSCNSSVEKPTEQLQAKKRKLIVERKPSSDARDVKFREYISHLFADNPVPEYPSTLC